MKGAPAFGLALLVALVGPGVDGLGAQVRIVDGTDQHWYTGRQLRQPLVVALSDETAESCGLRQVAFDAGSDGEMSPALAAATWDGSRCVATSWWSLGSTVGLQHARATLSDGDTRHGVTFQAVARQGARIFFGGAWSPREEGWVDLVEPATGDAYLRDVAPESVFRPIVGVDFPVWPSWRRVRMAVGASARDIDQFFYFGWSALQAFVFGPGQEGSAVDVHVGVQLSRRQVGASGAVCAPALLCRRRVLHFSGVTFMLAVDGASAFKGLAGAVLR